MAGRGMLFEEGPTACPFVALESDRDRRAAQPDPRHRCYAEPMPAPRALAHQREFCLATSFGSCPIFQDWAIRAAARPVPLRPATDLGTPRDEEPSGPEQLHAFVPPPAPPPDSSPEPASPASSAPAGEGIERIASLPLDAPAEVAPELVPEESAPDESAPEQAASQAAPAPSEAVEGPTADEARADEARAHEPDAATDKPARRRWAEDWPPAANQPAAKPPATGRTGHAADPPAQAPVPPRTPQGGAPPSAFLAGRDAAGAGRRAGGQPAGRPAESAAGRAGTAAELPKRVDYAQRHDPGARQQARPSPRDEWAAQRADLIPSWERERYAAYPTIRTRLGAGDGGLLLSRLTRLFGIAAVIALIVALLAMAPGFLAGIGSPGPASPSPSPTIAATPTASPTPEPTPEPTVLTHRVRAGETLFGIASQYGVTLEQILAANPAITNPNLIQEGQLIVIPPDDFDVPTPEPLPSPTG